MGLLDKMTGCAAIVGNEMRRFENRRLLIETNVKAFGILGKRGHPSMLELEMLELEMLIEAQGYGFQPCLICLLTMIS